MPNSQLLKTPTGVEGLDEITNGGLPTGRATLVCGGAGSGKTVLSVEFLIRGIVQYGEPALELLKGRIQSRLAAVEKQWDGGWRVIAGAGELRQVFSNLLANSLDAIDEAGVIKLRLSAGVSPGNGHRCTRITLADNGKGIAPSARAQLFEPFFTTKGATGTGLGLWVSKQIVDKHGGTIRVRSSTSGSRRGTVVSIVLPAELALPRRLGGIPTDHVA